MRKIFSKKNCYKYLSAILVLVFLVTGFLLLKKWEDKRSKKTVENTENESITYNGKEYKRKNGIETFLVLGLDKYEDSATSQSHSNGVQTDFLMLFVFDTQAKQCTAVQINRDTMTNVNKLSIGGTTVVERNITQIALAYNYVNDNNDKIRCRNTKDSVEYLLGGIKVDHYLSVTMNVVPVCCDCIGGVEVEVLDDFTGIDDTLIQGEKVTLSGEHALRYIRSRYGLEDSSNSTRMLRQQQFVEALYKKVNTCAQQDGDFLINLIDSVDDYVVFDSSNQKMMEIADRINNYEFLGIKQIEGETQVNEHVEFYPNPDSIEKIVMELFYSPATSNGE